MSRETKPFKLDPQRDDGEVRYYYDDSEITADFDVSEELAAHEASYAARASGSKSSTGLAARVRKLKAEVGQKGMTPAEAEKLDPEAFNECFTALEGLHARYLRKPGNGPRVGEVYRKSFVAVTARRRAGKDTFVDALIGRLIALAALAGQEWHSVNPAGRNALELVGSSRAEIAHHEDMRYQALPEFDEALRYFDPDRSAEAGTRNKNTPAPVARVIVATSTESLASLGLTLMLRKGAADLMEDASTRAALDVDEFMLRVGWSVEVHKPAHILNDYEALRREAVVTISRILDGGANARRVERVENWRDQYVGKIITDHVVEPVAVIRGIENAARFLAASILEERNSDIWEALPLDARQLISVENHGIMSGTVEAHEQRALDALAAQPGSNRPEVLAHFREAHLDGLATPDPEDFPIYWDGKRHYCNAHSPAVYLD